MQNKAALRKIQERSAGAATYYLQQTGARAFARLFEAEFVAELAGTMPRCSGIFVMDRASFDLVFGPAERAQIADLVDIVAPPQTAASVRQNLSHLQEVELIFSGWGAPLFDDVLLNAAPKLQAIFYAAGAMGNVLTPTVWERGITVTSAIVANSRPVAEYTLATILFSLKHGWRLARETQAHRRFVDRNAGVPGCFGSTIGLISLGTVARELIRLLKSFDVHVIAFDPHISADEAAALGIEQVSLTQLFSRSDVVSLHTPLLPETKGMITGDLLLRMRQGAAFINTARGEVVQQEDLIQVAMQRTDLQFILDVATPEPPVADSALYELPNVVLTPHIAGSVGNECRRMGQYMVEELQRFTAGKPLRWEVTPAGAKHSAHRPKAWTLPNGERKLFPGRQQAAINAVAGA